METIVTNGARKLCRILNVCIAVAALWTTASQANEQRHVMFILDASNSMWGQIDGRAKIDIAKEVLARQFSALPESTLAGLIAYGHRFDRTLNDCGDMELVGGYDRYEPSVVKELLDYVTPKGQTPIAATLEESIGWVSVDNDNQPVASPTVVLITDGTESCDGDPCAAAAKLSAAGIDAKVHVVGFDLNDEQRALVGCIAENGHGRYFDAQDASGLAEALAQVAQAEIVQSPEREAPATLARQSVFVDDFDGAELAEHWAATNEDIESYIVDNGELLAINSKLGGLSVAETNNIFVLDASLPDGDWDATITFKADLKTGKDRIQFGLWQDAQNGLFSTLWTQTGIANCNFAGLSISKVTNSEPVIFDLPVLGSPALNCGAYSAEGLTAVVAPLAERLSTITMHKRKRSYHFSADLGWRNDAGETLIYQTEPLTSLRVPGKLAFTLGKHDDAQGELAIMVDRVEVFAVSQ